MVTLKTRVYPSCKRTQWVVPAVVAEVLGDMWSAIVLLFISQWTANAQGRVQSLTIIEYLAVIKQAATCLNPTSVSDVVDARDLQQGQSTFDRRIIVTISIPSL